MDLRMCHLRPLFILLILVIMLASGVTPLARAQTPPATWAAWGLSAGFKGGKLQVKYAVYVGIDGPHPRVITSTDTLDISSNCIEHGMTYQGDLAVFDGKSYIECELPDWSKQVAKLAPYLPVAFTPLCECKTTRSPFWVSADAILDPVQAQNPVFDGTEVGFTFSLPSNGISATTQIDRPITAFQSPLWAIDSNGNRMVVGQHGPLVVAIASYFGGLNYLDPGWTTFFKNQVSGNSMGQWLEPSFTTTQSPTQSQFSLNTGPATVYIGYNEATGQFLNGKMRALRIDPGCKSS